MLKISVLRRRELKGGEVEMDGATAICTVENLFVARCMS